MTLKERIEEIIKEEIELDEEKIWKILAEQFSCKPNKENCSFKMCNQWARCANLVYAITKGDMRKGE